MHFTKKLIKRVLCFSVLCIALACTNSYADETHDEALGFINAYSDSAKYFPEDMESAITREQFINIAANLFGINAGQKDVSFTDIDAESESYVSVRKAVFMNWISDGTSFRPTESIKYDEAVKILCSAAGYDVYAKLLGGYPNGYRSAAKRAKISADVSDASALTGYEALELIWNTLNANILEQTGFGDNTKFETSDDTVMAEFLDVYYEEGIINANEFTSLTNKSDLGEDGRVEIAGKSFKLNNKSVNGLLGYNVRAYYKWSGGDKKGTVGYAYPADNKVLQIDADDASYDAKKHVITYASDKEEDAKLNSVFDYVYNGRAYFDAGDKIIPERGKLILIDNDNDGIYEVISVKHYSYMTVKSFNKYYLTLTDSYDKDKSLDLGKSDRKYSYKDQSGNQLNVSDIKSGSIIADAVSHDDILAELILCSKKESGVLKQISKDDKTFVFGDGAEYELSEEIEDKINTYILNREYRFTLGICGEIVSMTQVGENWIYAYLKKAYISRDLAGKLNLSLFTQDGEHIAVTAEDEKIKVTGETKKLTSDEIYDKICEGGVVKPQLIKCLISKDNTLKGIAFSETVSDIPITNDTHEDTIKQYDFGTSTFYYRNTHFYPYFNISGSVIFKVPTDVGDDDLFEVGYSFSDGNKEVSVYDIKPSGSAGAVVYVSDNATIEKTGSSEIFVIEKVWDALDKNDMTAKKIYGWCNGKYTEYTVDSKKSGDDLKSGDVIRFIASGNEIKNYTVDFNSAKLAPSSAIASNFNMKTTASFSYIGGKLYYNDGGYVYLTDTKDSNGIYDTSAKSLINAKMPDMAKCVVYDMKDKTLRPADSSYLKSIVSCGNDEACYVLIRSNQLNSSYAIIYVP